MTDDESHLVRRLSGMFGCEGTIAIVEDDGGLFERCVGVECRSEDDQIHIGGPALAIERYLMGEALLQDLGDLRFRSPDSEWCAHPQAAFVTARVDCGPLPGASLVWQQTLIDAPTGELHLWHEFVDGDRIRAGLGRHNRPQLSTIMDYCAVLELMEGSISPLDALERGGDISGEWSSMLLLLGLADDPRFTMAMRAAVGALGPLLRAMQEMVKLRR